MTPPVLSTSPPAHYEFHIFISYTNREEEVRLLKPFLDRYKRQLREDWPLHFGLERVNVFYDEWRLQKLDHFPDDMLRAQLEDAIRRSAFVVAFLSPHYFLSEWCQWELRTARKEHARRGPPAPGSSCLPILWKKPHNGINGALFSQFLKEHRVVDVSDGVGAGNPTAASEPQGLGRSRFLDAVRTAVGATINVGRQWFPTKADPPGPFAGLR
jgi:hypothetical protein